MIVKFPSTVQSLEISPKAEAWIDMSPVGAYSTKFFAHHHSTQYYNLIEVEMYFQYDP